MVEFTNFATTAVEMRGYFGGKIEPSTSQVLLRCHQNSSREHPGKMHLKSTTWIEYRHHFGIIFGAVENAEKFKSVTSLNRLHVEFKKICATVVYLDLIKFQQAQI